MVASGRTKGSEEDANPKGGVRADYISGASEDCANHREGIAECRSPASDAKGARGVGFGGMSNGHDSQAGILSRRSARFVGSPGGGRVRVDWMVRYESLSILSRC